MRIELIFLRLVPSPSGGLHYRVDSALRAGATPDDAARALAAGSSASSAEPLPLEVLHSTSWRHDPAEGLVLTYAAAPDPRPDLPAVPLQAPSVVCSGDPLRPAPDVLHAHHVAAHAVRHLAYLGERDPGIADAAARPRLRPLWRVLAEAAAAMPTGTHEQAHAAAEHVDRLPATGS